MARTKKPATKKASSKATEPAKAPEMASPTAPLEISPSRATKKQPEKKGTRIKQVAKERAVGVAHLRSKGVSSSVPDTIPTASKKTKEATAVQGKGKEKASVPMKRVSSKSKSIPKSKATKVSKGADKEGEKLDKIIEEIAQSVEKGVNKDFSIDEMSKDEGSVNSAHEEEEEVVAEGSEEADGSEFDNEPTEKDVAPEEEEKEDTPSASKDIESEKESEGVEEEQSIPTEVVEPVVKPKKSKAPVRERKSKRVRTPVNVEEEVMEEDDLDLKGKKPRSDKDEELIAGSVWIDGIWFKSVEVSREWDIKRYWSIVPEKVLIDKLWNVPEVLLILKRLNLTNSLYMPKPSVHQIVLEVIGNLEKSFKNKEHADYGAVWIRGKKVFITPEAINEYFGCTAEEEEELPPLKDIASVLTGGKKKNWSEGSNLKSNLLTDKFAVLHSICNTNWIPTPNKQAVTPEAGKLIFLIGQLKPINFGQHIFSSICKFISTKNSGKKCIGPPSLIYELVISQAPTIRKETDRVAADLGKLYADYKLFGGDHYPDVERKETKRTKAKNEDKEMEKGSKSFFKLQKISKSEKVLEYMDARLLMLKEEMKCLTLLLRELRYPSEESSQDDASAEDSSDDSEE